VSLPLNDQASPLKRSDGSDDRPQALNALAERRLLAGDPQGARALLKEALAQDPEATRLWLNLAAAENGARDLEGEEKALGEVLKREPRHLRALLQLGALHERREHGRTAAAVYRRALESVPRGPPLPPEILAHLQHAQRRVAANAAELERLLEVKLEGLRRRHEAAELSRVEKCMATLLQKQPIYRQRPTFMHFPEVPAIEFYDPADFPWLRGLEAAVEDIRGEYLRVLAEDQDALEPYVADAPSEAWRELHRSRRWSVYYLWRAGRACEEALSRCPKTARALEAWPQCVLKGTGPSAVFSILDARTRIPPHTGVNNARLIVHLPLIVPPDCWFRVGSETRIWEPGRAMVFDDTIEHEAWNGSDEPRTVMILDIWNPYLSAEEREAVTALTDGVGEFYGALPEFI
jgi:aspartyl/asparaginyl beta-hydroxylase (cupin superfamily)